jgi:hypothetical protein
MMRQTERIKTDDREMIYSQVLHLKRLFYVVSVWNYKL